jgi:hypothetical protein
MIDLEFTLKKGATGHFVNYKSKKSNLKFFKNA